MALAKCSHCGGVILLPVAPSCPDMLGPGIFPCACATNAKCPTCLTTKCTVQHPEMLPGVTEGDRRAVFDAALTRWAMSNARARAQAKQT